MGLSNIEVKKLNKRNVFRFLLEKEQVSKSTLAASLGLSIPTVTQCLNELIAMNLVREDGVMESVGGRKSMGFAANKNYRYALGVDITQHHINLVVTNLASELVAYKRIQLHIENREEDYQKLKNHILDFLETAEIDLSDILGMGVSIPALVEADGRKIYHMHEKMKVSFQLYDILSSWFTGPIIIENDANCAGAAEMKKRNTEENLIYFFVSPSVGGSIFMNGKGRYGKKRASGEFGHMTLIPHGRRCYCGREGCVDGYCNTELLARTTGNNLDLYFRKLEAGEEEQGKLWEEYMDYLALAVHNLLNVFDEKVVIGGYLGQYMGKYIQKLRKKVQMLDKNIDMDIYLDYAKLKYEASALGAAETFVEQYIEKI